MGARVLARQNTLPRQVFYRWLSSHIHASNSSSFCFNTVSRPATALTIDSTDWLVCRMVSALRSSKDRIFCSFSPSALRIWDSAACWRATDSNRSVIAWLRGWGAAVVVEVVEVVEVVVVVLVVVVLVVVLMTSAHLLVLSLSSQYAMPAGASV